MTDETRRPSFAKCGLKLLEGVVSASANKSGQAEVVNTIVMQSAGSVSESESLVRAFQSGKRP